MTKTSKIIGNTLAVLIAAAYGVYFTFYRSGEEPAEVRLPAPGQTAPHNAVAAQVPPGKGGPTLVNVGKGGGAVIPLSPPAPIEGASLRPIKLRQPAGAVLEKLAQEAGIDPARYSEEQKNQFALLLEQGRYAELAQQVGVDLRSVSPQRLARLEQILTAERGGDQGQDAEAEDGPSSGQAPPPHDPYQKLREEAGVENLYDLENDEAGRQVREEERKQRVLNYMAAVAEAEEETRKTAE